MKGHSHGKKRPRGGLAAKQHSSIICAACGGMFESVKSIIERQKEI